MCRFILVLFLFILTACAGTGPKKANIGDQSISIGYHEGLASRTGFYASLLQKNGEWQLVQISDSRISPMPGEEVLFVAPDISYAQPVFEKVEYFNGSTFECGVFLSDDSSYTPCTSEFTKANVGMSIGKNLVSAALTAGLASGSHQEIDRNEIALAIQQSELIQSIQSFILEKEEARRKAEAERKMAERKADAERKRVEEVCADNRKIVDEYFRTVSLEKKTSNLTGYKIPDDLVVLDKKIASNLSCPIDPKAITFEATAKQFNHNYKVEIEQSKFVFGIDEPNPQFTFNVKVLEKEFVGVKPYKSFTNEDLTVNLKEVWIDNGKINMDFSLSNKSGDYIVIEKYSLYIDSSILTPPQYNDFELPPKAIEHDIKAIVYNNDSKIVKDAKDSISRCLNKRQCDNSSISLGFSVKYNRGGAIKTLYGTKVIPYGKIAYALN